MINHISDGEDGLDVLNVINALVDAANTPPATGITFPITRQVYLAGNSADQAAMGGTAGQVYDSADAAYTAAKTLRALLGNSQIVAMMVRVTVTTSVNGVYTTTVGGVTLSADWDPGIVIIGINPKVSVIDFIDGSSATGNAYNLPVTITNMRIGASSSGRSITSSATGASGNSGSMILKLCNTILHGGLVSNVTNASNTSGNGGDITISNIFSISNSDIIGEVVIDSQINTSAQSGGTGNSGGLTLAGTFKIFGNITTANGSAGGSISIANFTSFNFISGSITLNSTSTSGITFRMTNTICSSAVSVNIPGSSTFSCDRCSFAALTMTTSTGTNTAVLNSCEISGLYTSNAATATLATLVIFAGISTLGNNSVLSLVSISAGTGSPAINGIGTGCSILNSSVQGGTLSIDHVSARTVISRNTTLINSVGSNITIKSADTPQTLTDATTVVWNMDLGFNSKLVIGGNRTLSITNVKPGQYGTIKIVQDATGGRTLALPASSKVANAGAGVLPLSTAGSAIDIATFYYDGTEYIWTISPNAT